MRLTTTSRGSLDKPPHQGGVGRKSSGKSPGRGPPRRGDKDLKSQENPIYTGGGRRGSRDSVGAKLEYGTGRESDVGSSNPTYISFGRESTSVAADYGGKGNDFTASNPTGKDSSAASMMDVYGNKGSAGDFGKANPVSTYSGGKDRGSITDLEYQGRDSAVGGDNPTYQRPSDTYLAFDSAYSAGRESTGFVSLDNPSYVRPSETYLDHTTGRTSQAGRDTLVSQRDNPLVSQRDNPLVSQRDNPLVSQRDNPQRDNPAMPETKRGGIKTQISVPAGDKSDARQLPKEERKKRASLQWLSGMASGITDRPPTPVKERVRRMTTHGAASASSGSTQRRPNTRKPRDEAEEERL